MNGLWATNKGRIAEPFEDKYIPEPNSGCWLWIRGVDGGGYGHTNKGYAHRLAYERYVGPIPKGLLVCHKCDTIICINPDHLFLGTQKDNMADAARKGRLRNGR